MELPAGSAPLLGTLAGVAEARGDCGPALSMGRRAVELLPEGLDDTGRAPYRARMARLEKCAARIAPPLRPCPHLLRRRTPPRGAEGLAPTHAPGRPPP